MGGRIIAGVIGFVVLVLLVQTCVLGGDDDGGDGLGRTGAAPTATLPAQTPEAISLGAVQPAGSTGAGSQTSGSTTYIVKEGDTLGTIATSFNVPEDAQAAWISEVLDLNAIADARLLQAGQELQIPAPPPAPGTTPGVPGIATATPTPEGASGAAAGTYIVESGDTPFGIAEKLCVESPASWVNELVALNSINPNNLTVGQELELPAGTPSNCP